MIRQLDVFALFFGRPPDGLGSFTVPTSIGNKYRDPIGNTAQAHGL
jgi:hypothetical protein